MPGVKKGQGGIPFLQRELQKGNAQQKMMDVPQPGGVGQASPTGLGGTNVRPNQPPAKETAPKEPKAAPAQDISKIPARPRQEAAPAFLSIPRIDDEFPISDLVGATGQGQNIPASTLGERFYRRYGRYPTETDLGIIAVRRRFEKDSGRPPTRDELLSTLRNNMIVNREDEFLG